MSADPLSENRVAPIWSISTISHPLSAILSIPKASEINLDRSSLVRVLEFPPGFYTLTIKYILYIQGEDTYYNKFERNSATYFLLVD